jgi:hypothetical protein
MSSTDLANEATKKHIRIAEAESLAHSILQKTRVPLAKITHKGLQEIEVEVEMGVGDDVGNVGVGGVAVGEIAKAGPKAEEEERRERERRARTASFSTTKPESPITPSWVPSALSPTTILAPGLPTTTLGPGSVSGQEADPNRSFFFPTPSDFESMPVPEPEPELNLDELINIDEDASPSALDTEPTPELQTALPGPGWGVEAVVASPTATAGPITKAPPAPLETSLLPTITTTTGTTTGPGPSPGPGGTALSPFASTPSFDLNSLWSAPAPAPLPTSSSTPLSHLPPNTLQDPNRAQDSSKSERKAPQTTHAQVQSSHALVVDRDILGPEAADQDFDMFLETQEDGANGVGGAAGAGGSAGGVGGGVGREIAAFNALPVVWSGMVSACL